MLHHREQRIIGAHVTILSDIDRWLWCLDDARRRTLQRLEGLDPKLIDWETPESGNSIGCILYHIAAIEVDYLFADLLAQPTPPDLSALLPYEIREENGHLTPIRGFDLDWYLHRLDVTRSQMRDRILAMSLEDFRRARHLTDRAVDITPEWTLYHLTQHEAEHRGELCVIRSRAEAAIRSAQ